MNIAIILEHFRYFIDFYSADKQNNYYFLTTRHKYLQERIPNLLFCDNKLKHASNISSLEGDWENYFRASIVLKSIPDVQNLINIASLYERYFRNTFYKIKIDLLISGGTTGFERCGISIAKKLGIKTLCVWEGYFRPYTLSVDEDGMNAESSFFKKSFESIVSHIPSKSFKSFLPQYLTKVIDKADTKKSLAEVQNKRFVLSHQLRNRWCDRNDFERIRLPFKQHGFARINYYVNKNKYVSSQAIKRPYIFFPLQTHTDSNIILNSDLYPFARYVQLVIDSFLQIQHKLKCNLIIKEHPYDVFRTWYKNPTSEYIQWFKPEISTWQILSNINCIATIVVNSTVGFESLLINKPVLVLGRSVYAYKELVVRPDNYDVDSLTHSIEKLTECEIDKNQIYLFAASLYDTMQIEGRIDSILNQKEIKNFIKRYFD